MTSDQGRGAEVRPGIRISEHDRPELLIEATETTDLIWEAVELKRIARDWKSDPAYRRLHDRLKPRYLLLSELPYLTASQMWRMDMIARLFGLTDHLKA